VSFFPPSVGRWGKERSVASCSYHRKARVSPLTSVRRGGGESSSCAGSSTRRQVGMGGRTATTVLSPGEAKENDLFSSPLCEGEKKRKIGGKSLLLIHHSSLSSKTLRERKRERRAARLIRGRRDWQGKGGPHHHGFLVHGGKKGEAVGSPSPLLFSVFALRSDSR